MCIRDSSGSGQTATERALMYTAFAYGYDESRIMCLNDEWAEYLIGLLKENGVMDGLVCELRLFIFSFFWKKVEKV